MKEVAQWLDLAESMGAECDLNQMDPSENTAWIKYGFVLAFMLLLRPKISLDQAISETISLGGDTNSNAAVVGAMIGAYLGESNLPETHVQKILNCDLQFSQCEDRPISFQPARSLMSLFDHLVENCPNDFEVEPL